MRLPLCAIALLASALPVAAAETAWQQVAPDVSIRLISSGTISAAGTTTMALEIDMPQGTKTYWRVPGETGLPLEIDLGASSGIADYRVLWPYPVSEHKNGYLDHVYFGHTVLPLEIAVSQPMGKIEMATTLGICSEICIPAQATFSLPLIDAAPDRPSGLRIKQAIAEVPIEWDQADEPFGDVMLLADDATIGVEIEDAAIDATSLIAATAEGDTLFGLPQKSQQPGLVLLPILGKSDNSALQGEEVELTFMTDQGAYVVSRTIGSGTDLEATAGQ